MYWLYQNIDLNKIKEKDILFQGISSNGVDFRSNKYVLPGILFKAAPVKSSLFGTVRIFLDASPGKGDVATEAPITSRSFRSGNVLPFYQSRTGTYFMTPFSLKYKASTNNSVQNNPKWNYFNIITTSITTPYITTPTLSATSFNEFQPSLGISGTNFNLRDQAYPALYDILNSKMYKLEANLLRFPSTGSAPGTYIITSFSIPFVNARIEYRLNASTNNINNWYIGISLADTSYALPNSLNTQGTDIVVILNNKPSNSNILYIKTLSSRPVQFDYLRIYDLDHYSNNASTTGANPFVIYDTNDNNAKFGIGYSFDNSSVSPQTISKPIIPPFRLDTTVLQNAFDNQYLNSGITTSDGYSTWRTNMFNNMYDTSLSDGLTNPSPIVVAHISSQRPEWSGTKVRLRVKVTSTNPSINSQGASSPLNFPFYYSPWENAHLNSSRIVLKRYNANDPSNANKVFNTTEWLPNANTTVAAPFGQPYDNIYGITSSNAVYDGNPANIATVLSPAWGNLLEWNIPSTITLPTSKIGYYSFDVSNGVDDTLTSKNNYFVMDITNAGLPKYSPYWLTLGPRITFDTAITGQLAPLIDFGTGPVLSTVDKLSLTGQTYLSYSAYTNQQFIASVTSPNNYNALSTWTPGLKFITGSNSVFIPSFSSTSSYLQVTIPTGMSGTYDMLITGPSWSQNTLTPVRIFDDVPNAVITNKYIYGYSNTNNNLTIPIQIDSSSNIDYRLTSIKINSKPTGAILKSSFDNVYALMTGLNSSQTGAFYSSSDNSNGSAVLTLDNFHSSSAGITGGLYTLSFQNSFPFSVGNKTSFTSAINNYVLIDNPIYYPTVNSISTSQLQLTGYTKQISYSVKSFGYSMFNSYYPTITGYDIYSSSGQLNSWSYYLTGPSGTINNGSNGLSAMINRSAEYSSTTPPFDPDLYPFTLTTPVNNLMITTPTVSSLQQGLWTQNLSTQWEGNSFKQSILKSYYRFLGEPEYLISSIDTSIANQASISISQQRNFINDALINYRLNVVSSPISSTASFSTGVTLSGTYGETVIDASNYLLTGVTGLYTISSIPSGGPYNINVEILFGGNVLTGLTSTTVTIP